MPGRLCTAIALIALAGAVASVPASAGSTNALPMEQMQGSTAYLSGGIGLEESKAIRLAASKYPLGLEFVRAALPRAEYLSDIKVTITGRAGNTVLDTVSTGPFLLARLPTGSFTVTVQQGDVAKQRIVNIKTPGHERLMFVWH